MDNHGSPGLWQKLEAARRASEALASAPSPPREEPDAEPSRLVAPTPLLPEAKPGQRSVSDVVPGGITRETFVHLDAPPMIERPYKPLSRPTVRAYARATGRPI